MELLSLLINSFIEAHRSSPLWQFFQLSHDEKVFLLYLDQLMFKKTNQFSNTLSDRKSKLPFSVKASPVGWIPTSLPEADGKWQEAAGVSATTQTELLLKNERGFTSSSLVFFPSRCCPLHHRPPAVSDESLQQHWDKDRRVLSASSDITPASETDARWLTCHLTCNKSRASGANRAREIQSFLFYWEQPAVSQHPRFHLNTASLGGLKQVNPSILTSFISFHSSAPRCHFWKPN